MVAEEAERRPAWSPPPVVRGTDAIRARGQRRGTARAARMLGTADPVRPGPAVRTAPDDRHRHGRRPDQPGAYRRAHDRSGGPDYPGRPAAADAGVGRAADGHGRALVR